MSKSILTLALVAALLFAGAVQLFGQTVPPGGKEQVDRLIAVLKSEAPQKDKADACRGLAVIGTKDAVPALAALLGDEKLSHMARYALEPIPDPAVDDALRDALGRLRGLPLVGVIGSIGVRRDAKAVEALGKMLQDSDANVAQTAARALGSIGTVEAAKALQSALAGAPAAHRLALCEGLFRAAESLAAKGHRDEALAVYDRLRGLPAAAHQVRAGALRGAILARGQDGLALLREHLGSKDYVLAAAVVRTAQEIPGPEVTRVLTAELGQLPADHQVLVIQTLGKRADAAAVPALVAAAKAGPKPVRLAAVRSLAEIGHTSVANAIIGLMEDPDRDISQAAQESLAAVPGKEVEAAVMAMLSGGETSRRLTAMELIGQRRMTAAVPALLEAAKDADANVRRTALKRLGELGSPAEWPALVGLLIGAKEPQDLDAAEQALSAVWAKADNPDSLVEKLPGALAQAPVHSAHRIALLRVLGKVGGAGALKAVRAAVKDSNAEVRAAATRTLAAWKTADVVPDLLALAKDATDPADKMLGLRGYLGWAAKADLPAGQRLSICREAAGLARKPDERKLLLAALGSIPSPDALAQITPYLEDAATKDEACAAAMSVAENLLKGQDAARVASKLIEPLKKVAQVAPNADLAERAKAALEQAQNKAGGK